MIGRVSEIQMKHLENASQQNQTISEESGYYLVAAS